jgi:hypothetical protein
MLRVKKKTFWLEDPRVQDTQVIHHILTGEGNITSKCISGQVKLDDRELCSLSWVFVVSV